MVPNVLLRSLWWNGIWGVLPCNGEWYACVTTLCLDLMNLTCGRGATFLVWGNYQPSVLRYGSWQSETNLLACQHWQTVVTIEDDRSPWQAFGIHQTATWLVSKLLQSESRTLTRYRRLKTSPSRKDFLTELVGKVESGEVEKEEMTAHVSTLVWVLWPAIEPLTDLYLESLAARQLRPSLHLWQPSFYNHPMLTASYA